MATIQIVIHTDGDAFHGGAADREVARILRRVANDFADGRRLVVADGNTAVLDSNGNTCGAVAVTVEP